MAAAQRPGGQQAKICQFKLVLLGGLNNFRGIRFPYHVHYLLQESLL